MSRLIGRRVAIVGAGIAGLAVASALARRGALVEVYERAHKFQPVGAGLQISPNGMAVLDALRIDVPGVNNRAVELRDYAQGQKVLRLDLDGAHYPRAFRFVHRADLIDALQKSATEAGATIKLNHEVDPRDLDHALVIGADGLKSTLRPSLGNKTPPAFTGQVAWRTVIQDDSDSIAPEAHVYMGPHRHIVSYPLTGGRRNIVAVEEREDWVEEDWDLNDDPASLRMAFRDFTPEVLGWLERVEDVKLWGLFKHPVARRWQNSRHVLMGDAAHPTLPFLAQGANLALEDAWVLARHLDDEAQPDALALYEAERLPRTKRAVTAASKNARNYHLARPLVRKTAHTGLRLLDRFAPDLMLDRLDWLYRYDPTK